MNVTAHTPARRELLRLGEEALADTELYIAHIDALFASTVEQLRGGCDEHGLHLFSRAVSDLEQFLQLTDHLCATARLERPTELDAFRHGLRSATSRVFDALATDELVALSDAIEHELLLAFTRWPQAAAELQAGLSRQSEPGAS